MIHAEVCLLSVFLYADLKEMCELLGTEQSVLERAFSYRTVEAKLEKVSTTLNVAQVRGISVLHQLCQCISALLVLTLTHTYTHSA